MDSVTQRIVPRPNGIEQAVVPSIPNTYKSLSDISNVKIFQEPLRISQIDNQGLNDQLEKPLEGNQQTSAQATSALITLHEDMPLIQIQNNEPQTRHKREFKAQPIAESETKQEDKGDKYEDNEQNLTVTNNSYDFMSQQNIESKSEEEQTFKGVNDTAQDSKENMQRDAEKDSELEGKVNETTVKHKIHKISKEIIFKKHKLLNQYNNMTDDDTTISSTSTLSSETHQMAVTEAEQFTSRETKKSSETETSSQSTITHLVEQTFSTSFVGPEEKLADQTEAVTMNKAISEDRSSETTQPTLTSFERSADKSEPHSSAQGATTEADRTTNVETFYKTTFLPLEQTPIKNFKHSSDQVTIVATDRSASVETSSEITGSSLQPVPIDKSEQHSSNQATTVIADSSSTSGEIISEVTLLPPESVLTENSEPHSSNKVTATAVDKSASGKISPETTLFTLSTFEETSTERFEQQATDRGGAVSIDRPNSGETSTERTLTTFTTSNHTSNKISDTNSSSPAQVVTVTAERSTTEPIFPKKTSFTLSSNANERTEQHPQYQSTVVSDMTPEETQSTVTSLDQTSTKKVEQDSLDQVTTVATDRSTNGDMFLETTLSDKQPIIGNASPLSIKIHSNDEPISKPTPATLTHTIDVPSMNVEQSTPLRTDLEQEEKNLSEEISELTTKFPEQKSSETIDTTTSFDEVSKQSEISLQNSELSTKNFESTSHEIIPHESSLLAQEDTSTSQEIVRKGRYDLNKINSRPGKYVNI